MGWKDTIQENPDAAPKSWRDTVQDSSADAGPKQGWGESLVRGATGTLPYLGAIGTGALAAETGPGMLPAAGLGYATGKEAERLANHYLLGDDATDSVPQAAKRLGGNFVEGMTAEAGGQALSQAAPIVGKALTTGAEELATTPIVDKVANATNMVGKAKSVISKVAGALGEQFPGMGSKAADVASAIAGRTAIYKTPLAPVQAISDTATVLGGAQKGLGWILDNAPQKLGKFAPLLKNAAARGSAAFATTSFLLQQSDAEFQKIMKDNEEGN